MKEMDKLNKLINENIGQKTEKPCQSPQHMIPHYIFPFLKDKHITINVQVVVMLHKLLETHMI